MQERVSRISSNESWQKNIAVLIEHQRLRNFPAVLEDFLSTLCFFDTFIVVTYKKSLRPILIYPTAPEEQSDTLRQYISRAYVLDPLFHAIKSGIAPGVVRLVDIMPDSFKETEYFQTCYQNFGLVDEINLIVQLDDEVTCTLTLGRKAALDSISRTELNALNECFPVLSALVRQFWLAQSREYLQYGRSDGPMKRALRTFASGVLTQREREITDLILRGHSSQAIADQLKISVGTVKVHRKNIHNRLNTSTQAEIFTQFITHLNNLDES
ncbi:LuxR C-terminal-related transcriptional regulator [Marinobacter qingdaonensis]|jgi:DNA-binding CsgD family transcriptional regulator|uniref:LuxR C-terminal-related transcriptional regulator n=1 Tax=Marinobacter qingdaonensis TaxID=3108486 RepID=A0ABU5P1V7_9GAMM|nr:LuxR C-terminal-related transcriptional regulator [Marinobacter sp. ASW11-75]MEA1082050.1 LuxR C-terminal-related transcriptional regulator [Marinobacter sp. ASW11-75]MEE2764647.1 LuxR C-terminal-related transcriptional regulator [Pseudomonadota bacterium]MEE3116501.1 LuxR C-terminal-related transcriptional regulator [Pseudomonadota bacterium]